MAKYQRIVYLLSSPFCKRDYQRFGMAYFERSGYSVEIWDLTRFVDPDRARRMIPDPLTHVRLCHFSSFEEVLQALRVLPANAFVINIINYGPSSYRLYKTLWKRKCRYAVLKATDIPDEFPHIKWFLKLKKINWTSLKWNLWGKRKRQYDGEIILAGGEKFISSKELRCAEIIWIHALDYDMYLTESLRRTELNCKPKIVWLDSYLPFHPDFDESTRLARDPANYYATLCKFFDLLELNLGIEVVVAENPRAIREQHEPFWQGRQIISGQVASLICEAALVMTHGSTAIHLAVLFNKPILFVTFDQIERLRKIGKMGDNKNSLVQKLEKKTANIDHLEEVDWKKLMEVDQVVYQRYIENYIKKAGTPMQPFWAVVCDWVHQQII